MRFRDLRARLRDAAKHLRRDGARETSPSLSATADRVARYGVVLTLVAVAGQSVVHLVNLAFFDLGFALLNVDYDFSAFSWAATSATFTGGVMLLLLAVVRQDDARLALGLAFAMAFLSLDDATQIHERISELGPDVLPIEHAARTFWPLVYLPFLALVFAGLTMFAARLPRVPARILLIGLLLLAGAVLLEALSPALFALGLDHGDLGYEVEAVTEEGMELGGWMLVATALASTLVGRPDVQPSA